MASVVDEQVIGARVRRLDADDKLTGHARYATELAAFAGPLRRLYDLPALERIEQGLLALRGAVISALTGLASLPRSQASLPPASAVRPVSEQESASASQSDSHQTNSEPKYENLEQRSPRAESKISAARRTRGPSDQGRAQEKSLPLGLVLDACPDIKDWAPDGIRRWPDFLAAVQLVRPALGVSSSAWREAIDDLGEIDAAIALAAILQRHESSSDAVISPSRPNQRPRTTIHGAPAISSAGGYLRALAGQARAGGFSTGPLVKAIMAQRLKAKFGSKGSSQVGGVGYLRC